jgi:RNA polymerase sigma-70 factor (ECF subfamily)
VQATLVRPQVDDRTLRLNRMVSGLKARRPAALRQFYDEFGDAIRAVALRIVRNEHDAEEVLHDVAWTVHRKIDRFAGTSDFWRWVHVVSRNASLMHLRRMKRNPMPYDAQDLNELRWDPSLMPGAPSVEAQVSASLAAQKLDDALGKNTPLNQQLFERLVLQGQTVADAAGEAGLSVPATKSRLHRLRNDLRVVADAAF